MGLHQGEPCGYRIADADYARTVIRHGGHTVADIAARIGVSRQFVYLLLAGRRGCNISTARALCTELNVLGYPLFVDGNGAPVTFRTQRTMRKATQ
jgi:DNA-binding XRE family transcriptional regulator